MTKKIIVAVLLVGLIAVLVWGGINRTLAKTESRSEYASGAEEHIALGEGSTFSGGGELANNANRNGQGIGAGAGQGGGDGQAAREFTDQPGYAESGGNPQAEAAEWITLQGVVESVSEDAVVIVVSTGEVITLDGRAWSFAQEAGFSMQAGEEVSLTGFYEDGEFEIGFVEDQTSGQSIQLREQSGRPAWAGKGRGNN